MNKAITWHDVLVQEKKKPYFIKIMMMLDSKREAGITIYPPKKDIFNAFRLTELHQIKVVILGQDPYHGPGQAHGLAFSVRPMIPIPPSLMNIYKELKEDIAGFQNPNHGCLESWAKQGLLLLNSILTVEAGKAHSHAHFGWEIFTDQILKIINKECESVVFLLWGMHAKKKASFIDTKRHFVLRTSHPSPFSANYGFFGCKHFSHTNKILNRLGKPTINWTPCLL